MVHGIVKAHKGAVAVSSSPFERTLFEIYLPAATQSAPGEDVLSLAAPGGHERILFVEDDEDQLATIPRVLEMLGYKVSPASSADQARQMLLSGSRNFDLLLTDIDLPRISGLELARQAYAIDPLLPIILVSGQKPPSDLVESCRNVRKFVLKPYDRHTISLAIREALE